MSTVVTLKPDLDNLAGDRVIIRGAADFVRRRIAEMNAAETWIACGARLADLKKQLIKETPRGSNERIGWKQAFTLEPREFPFGRRHADKLIQINKFFSGRDTAT